MDSLEGSGDSIGRKQRKCALTFETPSELPTHSLEQVEELPPNTPEAQEYIARHSTEVSSVCSKKPTLIDSLKEIKSKREELEAWIKKAFDVDDLEQQIYLLNAKRRFSELSTAEEDSGRPGKLSKEDKPKLRLKLTNHDHSDTLPTVSDAQQHSVRGAKNLGRMSRPDTSAAPDLKPRIPNQVPIATFWNYIEQFFKRIDENDVKYLDDPNRVIDPTPFTIPPLGRHYLEQWREQYGYSTMSVGIRSLPNGSNVTSLKDRILSMLVPAKGATLIENDGDENVPDTPDNEAVNAPSRYPASLDARLRQELSDAGFLDPRLSAKDYQEDDELCFELRRLHSRLRSVSTVNQYRKKRLARHIREQILPAQELYALVDEIDKQVSSLYIKSVKSRKRGSGSDKSVAGKRTSSDPSLDATRLTSNRLKLVNAFGPSVGSRSTYLQTTAPSLSMFDRSVEERLRREANDHILWSQL